MTKFYVLTGLLLLVAILSVAHEFWLEPNRFFAAVGAVVSIDVKVGEGFEGERSEGKKNRIIQYIHLANGLKENLAPGLTNDHYGVATVKLATPGTHLIAFANTPKFLSMQPDSFLLYLKEDGLDNVIKARMQQGDTQKRSRELYQRCVKTLIQAGDKPDNTFATDTGMPLEIIPKQNPYALKAGQLVDVQILFKHKPLATALVRYWNRSPTNQLHQEQQRSDAQGHVRFRLKTGRNMISLVRMIPYKTPDGGPSQAKPVQAEPIQADWISYWGSLTFGCR